MIKRLTVICLAAALSGCGAPVTPQGKKYSGQDLFTLLNGATVHGVYGIRYDRKYTEKHNRDGSYEITDLHFKTSAEPNGVKKYGKWEIKKDRVCYIMDGFSKEGCVFVYAKGEYIQFISASSGKVFAFSSNVQYSRITTNASPKAPPPSAAPVPSPTAATPKGKLEPVSSGTGFVVNTDTYVLTNAHVIDDCLEVRVKSRHRGLIATVASQDKKNDLALLKLPPEDQPVAVFQELNTLYPGDSVVAVGFPLWGFLASEANVSVGTVSALAGMRNNTSRLQIAAPIQPGNSGGPLFDKSGLVVGVIVSIFGGKAMVEKLGVVPQNVNFAIKSGVAMALMRASGVSFTRTKSTSSLTPADIARKARSYTVLIECLA